MHLALFDQIAGSCGRLRLSVGVTGEPIWCCLLYQCKHWAGPVYLLQCRCHVAGLGERGSSDSDVCCSIVCPECRWCWRWPWLLTRDWEGSGCALRHVVDSDVFVSMFWIASGWWLSSLPTGLVPCRTLMCLGHLLQSWFRLKQWAEERVLVLAVCAWSRSWLCYCIIDQWLRGGVGDLTLRLVGV